jgi:acetyltransferase-like isoleucine patch superfamily enzyme
MNYKKYFIFLFRLVKSPKKLFNFTAAFIRGIYYIFYYKLSRDNVVIRFPFLCYDKVEISGPGSVFIDRKCCVFMNTFNHLTIHTLHSLAEVRIGENCTLGGLTIRCYRKIYIGDNVLTAGNLIQDLPICNKAYFEKYSTKYKESVITIGNNVWLSAQCLVATKSKICDGSVVGTKSFIINQKIPSNCLASGNPSMRPIPIVKLLKLSRKGD